LDRASASGAEGGGFESRVCQSDAESRRANPASVIAKSLCSKG